ncbi:hypothetical protein CGLO_08918 [Colletotrichum gloeosporioides Cg-14]|uniref:Uncharacterized protein n=1 Tax=Colletotrichum gloeosporioides (strain Cg-14) TaxID=1237896 RepID=T0KF02_COLGC|nr:hypothetical protein CGLO_08918 [Colletotrichum gloeosporioides Cg-14]
MQKVLNLDFAVDKCPPPAIRQPSSNARTAPARTANQSKEVK